MITNTRIMMSAAIAGSILAMNATAASAEMACLPLDLTFIEHSQHIHVHSCDVASIEIGAVKNPVNLTSSGVGAVIARNSTHRESRTTEESQHVCDVVGKRHSFKTHSNLN